MKEVSKSPEHTARVVNEFVSDPSDTLLGLVGRPGLRKSTALLTYAPPGEKSLLVEGHMSFIEFHIAMVQNCADPEFVRDALQRIDEWNIENDERSPSKRAMRIDTSPFDPYIDRGYQPLPLLVIDDARQLIDKKTSNEYIKIACDTRTKRFPRYSSSSSELNKIGNIKRYGFSGKVAITSNNMNDLKRGGILEAIESRGLVLVINYSKHVIHESAAERYLNGDEIDRLVFGFIEDRIDRVVDLSFRTYLNAVSYVRKAIKHDRPWQSELTDILCGIDEKMSHKESARAATATVMTDPRFVNDKNLTRRFEEFHRLTGISYPSFDRWVKKWQAEQRTGLPVVAVGKTAARDTAKVEDEKPVF